MTSTRKQRCAWVGTDPLMIRYHDREWGRPVHDDKKFFEALILDGAQAGLSWRTVLHKRENYRRAFSNFSASRVAKYQAKDLKRLVSDPGIIRNRLKIQGAVINARQFLKTQKEFGSFDKYIWRFVNYKIIKNNFKDIKQLPATSPQSDAMSKDLKIRGFKFVGSTICYAFMQAVGMVDDHTLDCWRRR